MTIAHTKVGQQTINPLPSLGPVVVGGVGGSGTRVVARMLIDMGLYVGSDLNPSYFDNGTFVTGFSLM